MHKRTKVKRCEICEQDYTPYGFDIHQRSVHGKNIPYKCNICDECFTTKDSRRHHKERVHSKRKGITCDLCGIEYSSKTTLNQHQKCIHSSIESHECEVCQKTYSTKKCLVAHYANNHVAKRIQKYNCALCDIDFNSKRKFEYHNSTKHEASKHEASKFECEKCDKTYKLKYLLNSHLKEHKEGRNTKCEICGKFFTGKGFVVHLRTVHTERLFNCNTCNKTFKANNTLERHIQQVHQQKKMFSCNVCDMTFNQKINMNKHIAEIHHQLKAFKCHSCYKTFKRKSHLNYHITDIHTTERVRCEQCNRTLKGGQKSLMRHMIECHTSDRRFKCNTCEMVFKRKAHLDSHTSAKHDDSAKKVPCEKCKKCFATKYDFLKHFKRMHIKKNPLDRTKCEVCDKFFENKDNCARHFKKMHAKEKEKPSEKCQLCTKEFSGKKTLKEHAKKFHPSN